MKHLGNIVVTKDNVHSFPAVDEIYGHLTIAAGAELRAPRLTLVRGWVTVQGHLVAPMLGLIDGWLTLAQDSSFSAIHLTEVRQDMTLAANAVIELPALRLTGQLNVQRDVERTLPGLIEIQNSLTLMQNTDISAPLLEKIGKSITLREGATLTAPNLNHIGGYADIDESAVLDAPRFTGG